MKRAIEQIIWVMLLLCMVDARAVDYVNGGYVGGKLGVTVSKAEGQKAAPNEGTIAYGSQGGYLQAGYVFDARTLVMAVGAFVDWNPSERHTNGVYYGSRSYGVDAKIGLPFGEWLPYAKLGYGYSTGTLDLRAVTNTTVNAVAGLEYKFAPQWSLQGEYKVDGFGGRNVAATSISNKIFSIGVNYYFNAPPEVVAPSPVVVEEQEEQPVPVAVPVPVMDAPPI